MVGKNHGRIARKLYYHGDYIKKPDPYVFGKEVDWIIFASAMAFLIFTILISYM